METVLVLADESENATLLLPRLFRRLCELSLPIKRMELVYFTQKNKIDIVNIVEQFPIDACYYVGLNRMCSDFWHLTRSIYDSICNKRIDLILSVNSKICKECAAGLAYLFKTGLAADCNGISFDVNRNKFCFERQIGGFPPKSAFVLVPDTLPQMATFIDVQTEDVTDIPKSKKKIIINEIPNTYSGIERVKKKCLYTNKVFSQYKVYFILGAGVTAFETAEKLREFTLHNKIGFGITRQVLNRGWYEESFLVGISGKKITPNVCVAFGVSGAYQHYVGIKDSKFIISINNDKTAPLANYADKAMIADVNEVIAELTHFKM